MREHDRYHHLRALTDGRGVFEHALLDAPRPDHGYCVDDVARALIVVIRDPDPDPDLVRLSEIYLGFLESAIGTDGLVHNRMNVDGDWTDNHSMGDWWGRLVWAVGTAAARAPDPSIRARAMRAFQRVAQQQSPDLRAIAFAALGASEVAVIDPTDAAARRLLGALVDAVPASNDETWLWPEPRLTYANGSIVEALIVAGERLDNQSASDRGWELLAFLLQVESPSDRLSVTGSGGRGPEQTGPQFDQQPIEVAAIADACARAYELTGGEDWRRGIELCWQWFLGHNDSRTVMVDVATGAGFDGLERHGRNENRGAESTLAVLSTYQQMRRLEPEPHV